MANLVRRFIIIKWFFFIMGAYFSLHLLSWFLHHDQGFDALLQHHLYLLSPTVFGSVIKLWVFLELNLCWEWKISFKPFYFVLRPFCCCLVFFLSGLFKSNFFLLLKCFNEKFLRGILINIFFVCGINLRDIIIWRHSRHQTLSSPFPLSALFSFAVCF